MTDFEFMLDVFREGARANAQALVWRGTTYSFAWLLDEMENAERVLSTAGLPSGAVTSLEGEISPRLVAFFLQLVRRGCIVVPLSTLAQVQRLTLLELCQAEWFIRDPTGDGDALEVRSLAMQAEHPLYAALRQSQDAGLILFTSGSTGVPKGAVHGFSRLLQKYKHRRRNLRTLMFLSLDHIGGIDTILYCLSNGSCLVIVDGRNPERVFEAIVQHRVEVLPVTPTFLKMLMLTLDNSRSRDLSSLKVITYGAEVMPESTLRKAADMFPGTQLLQKFGATEVGTLRSRSLDRDSTWVSLGGQGYAIRVVDGLLEIKAESSMLGYLNAPSPFTEDGWFRTGDAVEVAGEYIRIKGRASEVINVGGEKVLPAEVESVLEEIENIAEATVFGEEHALMGHVVCAKVVLRSPEDAKALASRVRRACRERLPEYKVPVKISIESQLAFSARFKKLRVRGAQG